MQKPYLMLTGLVLALGLLLGGCGSTMDSESATVSPSPAVTQEPGSVSDNTDGTVDDLPGDTGSSLAPEEDTQGSDLAPETARPTDTPDSAQDQADQDQPSTQDQADQDSGLRQAGDDLRTAARDTGDALGDLGRSAQHAVTGPQA